MCRRTGHASGAHVWGRADGRRGSGAGVAGRTGRCEPRPRRRHRRPWHHEPGHARPAGRVHAADPRPRPRHPHWAGDVGKRASAHRPRRDPRRADRRPRRSARQRSLGGGLQRHAGLHVHHELAGRVPGGRFGPIRLQPQLQPWLRGGEHGHGGAGRRRSGRGVQRRRPGPRGPGRGRVLRGRRRAAGCSLPWRLAAAPSTPGAASAACPPNRSVPAESCTSTSPAWPGCRPVA